MAVRVTIKDVAKQANVAISTASRVINNSGYVSEDTRQRVEEAIKRLGYVPNSIARSLKWKQTFSIGLIVSDIGNPFYAELAQAVERAARERGYSVLLTNTDSKAAQERDCVGVLAAKQVDGIIWYSPINEELVDEVMENSRATVVVITGKEGHLGHHTIRIDDQLGAFEAVNHLISLGHTRIGYIAEPSDPKFPQERMKGYRRALAEAGLEFDESLVVRGTYQEGSGRKAIKVLLGLEERPTAVFCANDLMAIEAMQYARGVGLRIPEDLAVVGFDNTKLACLHGIDLTTVAQPTYEMGREGAKLLISSITKPLSPRQLLLRPSLVVRRSCGQYLKEGQR
jgi:DNA-binding LacI/PurR family transcriptional regulator